MYDNDPADFYTVKRAICDSVQQLLVTCLQS